MLPIILNCPCGKELEVIPKTLKALGDIAKANDWKLIGGCRIGHHKEVAALCPICASAQKRHREIGDMLAER